MKVAVRYFSRSGRTKKIADAIASEAGVKALSVEESLSDDVDVLFLGCGLYGKIGSSVEKFLVANNVRVGKVVTFSTAALVNDLHPRIKKIAQKHNYKVADEHFHCPGVLAAKYRNRPNADDINNARKFAKDYLK